MTFTINGKDVELRQTMRAMLIYENIKGSSFDGSTLDNVLTFFYCCILACTKDFTITFEDFMDVLDDEPQKFSEFTNWIIEQTAVENEIKKKSQTKQTKQKGRKKANP